MTRATLILAAAATLPALAAGAPPGGDLPLLVQSYSEARGRLRQAREREAALEEVRAALENIALLDTPAALAFLGRELERAPAEVAALCPGPILAAGDPGAPRQALRGLKRREVPVREAVLVALATAERDLKALAPELARWAPRLDDPQLKRHLPRVLGRCDAVETWSALLDLVRAVPSRSRARPGGSRRSPPRGEDADPHGAEEAYRLSLQGALEASRNPAVRDWLAAGAFAAAGSDPARLQVVAAACGHLKVAASRSRLEELLGHEKVRVGTAALEALVKLGLTPSAAAVASQVERPGGLEREVFLFRLRALDYLAATGSDEALQAILHLAGARDSQLGRIALGALIAYRERPEAVRALLDALAAPQPEKRAVALGVLARCRTKSMIGPLIEHLEREDRPRLQADTLRLLFRLTGHNMGLLAADWRKWWEAAGPSFELPAPGAARSVTAVRVRPVNYFGIEVASDRAIFLADVSGSMEEEVEVRRRPQEAAAGAGGKSKTRLLRPRRAPGGGAAGTVRARKIEVLKRELARVIRGLPDGTRANIVTFETALHPWRSGLEAMDAGGRSRALHHIESLRAGGGTNVYDALAFALRDPEADTIYILTDGEPTAGEYVKEEEILRAVSVLNRARAVAIHAIAFGQPSRLLEKLAGENGGEYRFVDSY